MPSSYDTVFLGRTITETDVVLHAGQTGGFYPHQRAAEWCKTPEFGQRVAHGTLIFSVGVGMTAVAGQIIYHDRLQRTMLQLLGLDEAIYTSLAVHSAWWHLSAFLR